MCLYSGLRVSLQNLYSGGYLPLPLHENGAGPMSFQFILSLHSCNHFKNEYSHH